MGLTSPLRHCSGKPLKRCSRFSLCGAFAESDKLVAATDDCAARVVCATTTVGQARHDCASASSWSLRSHRHFRHIDADFSKSYSKLYRVHSRSRVAHKVSSQRYNRAYHAFRRERHDTPDTAHRERSGHSDGRAAPASGGCPRERSVRKHPPKLCRSVPEVL